VREHSVDRIVGVNVLLHTSAIGLLEQSAKIIVRLLGESSPSIGVGFSVFIGGRVVCEATGDGVGLMGE
jgi:hypothetical protein